MVYPHTEGDVAVMDRRLGRKKKGRTKWIKGDDYYYVSSCGLYTVTKTGAGTSESPYVYTAWRRAPRKVLLISDNSKACFEACK